MLVAVVVLTLDALSSEVEDAVLDAALLSIDEVSEMADAVEDADSVLLAGEEACVACAPDEAALSVVIWADSSSLALTAAPSMFEPAFENELYSAGVILTSYFCPCASVHSFHACCPMTDAPWVKCPDVVLYKSETYAIVQLAHIGGVELA